MSTVKPFQIFTEPQSRLPKFHEVELSSSPQATKKPPRPTIDVPDLPNEIWVTRIIQATLETLHGGRTVSQLRNVMGPRVLTQIQQRREVISRMRKGVIPAITTVKFWPLEANKVEITALCRSESHFFPIALRVEKQATTWKVMACEVGPY
jgi:hypothetical protein